MARKYNDYISVDTDFIPVFSAFSDKEFPTKWKSFYAHDNFKSILAQLADTLEMGSNEKNKSLWMYGAYGTGKTFASFVIKHLLEDDIEQVLEYCNANNLNALYTRLSGIRNKGKTLVVHCSSSAGIIGENRLFNRIIDSVKSTLKAQGYSYLGQKSQLENILETLKDPQSAFNFKNAFEQNRLKFEGYASIASIISDLETLPVEDSADLLENIIEVAEANNFIFTKSAQDTIAWLRDIREGNNLHAIVFVWDEFTEFFKNNQNNLTGLQEIAQASASIRFYLFLITHSGTEIIHDLQARKVIEARFKMRPFEMADTTAFMLMGQALKVNPDLANEWDKTKNELWNQVERDTKKHLIERAPEITYEELKKLLPIHPYAAYLLKVISKDISSNQRTMFQFLSGEYDTEENHKTNFRWFIDSHTNELRNWNYLTVDYLWTYFFTEENPDLDTIFKSAMSLYNNYLPLCNGNDDHERILRVALLLSAMQQKSGGTRTQGQSGLMRPTLLNIAYAFSATPIENKVEQTMAHFVQKNVFGKVEESGETLYIPPAGNIDQERWENLRKEISQQITFEKILTDPTYNVLDQFKLDGYLPSRYDGFTITPKEYQTAEKAIPTLKPSKVPLFYLFAKDETDQARVKPIIEKILINNSRPIIVDLSGQLFTEAAFGQFINEKTNERYYSGNPNYTNQMNLAKVNAKRIVDEWKQKLELTTLNIYIKNINDPIQVRGVNNLRRRLRDINNSLFGSGLEELTQNDKLFSSKGYTEEFAQFTISKRKITPNYAYVRDFIDRLSADKLWNDPNYWINNSNHPVSRMKIKLEEVMQDSFERFRKVAITDIWETLEQPPFGLFSCQGTVILMGFLLKEYADNTYYKNDGVNTVPLNSTDLSSLIFSAVKELPKANNQFIVKQTPEQIEFCLISGEIFRLPQHKRNSVDDVGKNISIFLSDNGYPLWSLKSFFENQPTFNVDKQVVYRAIDLFCEFVSTSKIIGRDRMIIQNDLYDLFKKNPSLRNFLIENVRIENMKKGMIDYVNTYKPEIKDVTDRLYIKPQEMLTSLLEKLSPDASYLWEIGDTNQQIDNLFIDYKLIDSINKTLSDKRNTFNDARRAIDQKMGLIKLPEPLILKELPQLKPILGVIQNIRNNDIYDKPHCILILDDLAEEFVNFFNNQIKVFSLAIQKGITTALTNDEIEELFSHADDNAYYLTTDKFIIQLNTRLGEYRKNKKINQLRQAWKTKTGTQSPEEWSKKNLIPIICLFQANNNEALVTFNLINQKTNIYSDEGIIENAISFVNSSAFEILNDLETCNHEFLRIFARDYDYVIDEIDDLKQSIAINVGNDVDSWMNHNRGAVDKLIEQYAKKQYETKYRQKVKEKIKELSPEKAQKYLNDLIWDKPLVGISILKEKE